MCDVINVGLNWSIVKFWLVNIWSLFLTLTECARPVWPIGTFKTWIVWIVTIAIPPPILTWIFDPVKKGRLFRQPRNFRRKIFRPEYQLCKSARERRLLHEKSFHWYSLRHFETTRHQITSLQLLIVIRSIHQNDCGRKKTEHLSNLSSRRIF